MTSRRMVATGTDDESHDAGDDDQADGGAGGDID